jgi:hypothetical protein
VLLGQQLDHPLDQPPHARTAVASLTPLAPSVAFMKACKPAAKLRRQILEMLVAGPVGGPRGLSRMGFQLANLVRSRSRTDPVAV